MAIEIPQVKKESEIHGALFRDFAIFSKQTYAYKEKEVCGVLFGDDNILKYYSKEDNKIYELAKVRWIWSILADAERGEIYFGSWESWKANIHHVYSLFSKFKSERNCGIEFIIKYKDEILDGGSYGLVKTLTDEVLISKKDMERNYVIEIKSLFVDENQNLYALVCNKDDTYSIITLLENSGRYSLGEEILHYDVKHPYKCQAITVPGKLKGLNGKTYPFSIISCVNLKYLDINGEKMKKSKVKSKFKQIERIALLSSSPNKIELIYSGHGLNEIAKVEIENGKVKKKETLVYGLSRFVYALEPVFDKKFHEKLVGKKK